MIEVVINEKKGFIRVSGHSNYAPIGQDIICAGVTSLVNGMYLYFEDLRRKEIELKNNFITKLKFNEKGTQFECKYDTDNFSNIFVVSVFAKMFTQFYEYNEYVKINHTPLIENDKTKA